MTKDKVDAYMPLWIGAYLADTQHLTRDEHGGYFLLLMAYWRAKAPLTDDDKRLAAIVKASTKEWKALRPTLSEFFQIDGGLWRHSRVERELADAMNRKIKASGKAKAAAEKRWSGEQNPVDKDAPSIAPSNAQAMPGTCPTTSTTTLPPEDSVPDGTGGKPPPDADQAETEKAEMWRAARSLLNSQGMPKGRIGSFIGKLAQDYGQDIVLKVIRSSVVARPSDAVGYIKAACRDEKASGGLRPPYPAMHALTVPSSAAAETAVMLAKQSAPLSAEEKALAEAARIKALEATREIRRLAAGAVTTMEKT